MPRDIIVCGMVGDLCRSQVLLRAGYILISRLLSRMRLTKVMDNVNNFPFASRREKKKRSLSKKGSTFVPHSGSYCFIK